MNNIEKETAKAQLLAPAGNMECLKTAFHFGADAVYGAGKRFGLRAFADNFSLDEMKEGCDIAHAHGGKFYLTVNALFRDEDFAGLPQYLDDVKKAGVDAVILSDPGVLTCVKEAGLEAHLSTQVSTMNSLSARFWYEAGVKRIVLAREASLADAVQIRAAAPKGLEIEAFVHGAMCVAYSGRCLLSSVFTGRSGNKGECAQPCRWRYTISEAGYPGQEFPIMEDDKGTYILNSKDLMMIEYLPQMIEAGIVSLKIEGRMKSAYYVGCVVNAYRRALDMYYADKEAYHCPDELLNELNYSATRRFTTGFFFGNPGASAQDTGKQLMGRGYTFCARVIEKCGYDGLIKIEQRNKFSRGDTLKVLAPGRPFDEFTVEEIINEEEEPQYSAPHPQQHLYINCPFELEPGDMLRRKDN